MRIRFRVETIDYDEYDSSTFFYMTCPNCGKESRASGRHDEEVYAGEHIKIMCEECYAVFEYTILAYELFNMKLDTLDFEMTDDGSVNRAWGEALMEDRIRWVKAHPKGVIPIATSYDSGIDYSGKEVYRSPSESWWQPMGGRDASKV